MSGYTPVRDEGSVRNARLDELEAEALYARDRFRLYRARTYGRRLTNPQRLRELELRSKFAESRLTNARAAATEAAPPG